MEKRKVVINKGQEAVFHNQVDYCIGTGRMGLALQKEYQEQLKLVQESGFNISEDTDCSVMIWRFIRRR